MSDIKWPITLGTTPDGENVALPLEALLRHAVVLGSTGSGKTVACKVIVEEAVSRGLPVICVDPQGDLASLGLCADVEVLERMGVDPAIAAKYHSKVEVKIWTPGSTHGIPINISPSIQTDGIERYEDRLRAYGAVAASLSSMCGYSQAAQIGEAATVAFSTILEYADTHGLLIEDLSDFADFLADPPMQLAQVLDPVFHANDRAKAEAKFRLKMLGSNRLLFDLGRPIHVDSLFGYEAGGANERGKVRVSVIYLNTLNTPEEKELFVGLLCSAIYQWMIQAASKTPIGLFYMDEVAPYLPPVRKPASKQGLMMLLRQARKYGLCCLLATQSPGDLDYKALGQMGTWALGKLTTNQDAAKVAPAIRAQAGIDIEAIMASITERPKGRFWFINSDVWDEPQDVQIRWLTSRHETLGPDDVAAIVEDSDRENFG